MWYRREAPRVKKRHSDHTRAETSILAAARIGANWWVTELVRRGVDLNKPPFPLETAVEHEQEEIIELLLGLGADPTKPCANLALKGNIRALEYLETKGAKLKSARISLVTLIEAGRYGMVTYLLSKGLEVRNRGALCAAARLGLPELAIALIEAGAEVDAAFGPRFSTPLLEAARNARVDMVRVLARGGANVNRSCNAVKPLTVAAEMANGVLLTALLEQGAEPTPLAMVKASNHGERSARILLPALLRFGGDVNAKDSKGWTPLTAAIKTGSLCPVLFLLEKGAKPDLASALIVAIENGRRAIAKVLIERGANVNQAADDGETPLSCAARMADEGLTRFLLERGADPNQPGEEGAPPLLAVALNRCNRTLVLNPTFPANWPGCVFESELTEMARRTLMVIKAHGGDLYQALESGGRIGDVTAVEVLLREGGDPNKVLPGGGTLLEYAVRWCGKDKVKSKHKWGYLGASWGYEGCKRLDHVVSLIWQGADPNLAMSNGVTPCFIAAQEGLVGCMKTLVKHGAVPTCGRGDGSTPLSIAIQNGHSDMVRLLLSFGGGVAGQLMSMLERRRAVEADEELGEVAERHDGGVQPRGGSEPPAPAAGVAEENSGCPSSESDSEIDADPEALRLDEGMAPAPKRRRVSAAVSRSRGVEEQSLPAAVLTAFLHCEGEVANVLSAKKPQWLRRLVSLAGEERRGAFRRAVARLGRLSAREAWSSLSDSAPVAVTASGGRPLDEVLREALPADLGPRQTLPVAVSYTEFYSRGDTVLSLWRGEWFPAEVRWVCDTMQKCTVQWAGEDTLTRKVPFSRVRRAVRIPVEFEHSGRGWRLVAVVESLPEGGAAVVERGRGGRLRRVATGGGG
eukprot:Hpha_TRINITY_DN22058_c0_g1::TRINITY_DN22058_c0_g1_i1::g.112160::m.112160/K10380/ANK; ankyrin